MVYTPPWSELTRVVLMRVNGELNAQNSEVLLHVFT